MVQHHRAAAYIGILEIFGCDVMLSAGLFSPRGLKKAAEISVSDGLFLLTKASFDQSESDNVTDKVSSLLSIAFIPYICHHL